MMLMAAIGLSVLTIVLAAWIPSSPAVTITMIGACTLYLGTMTAYLIGLQAEALLSQNPPSTPYTVSESIRRD
jgi:hypothetical protein